jgi:hypothetical protein
MRHEGDEFDLWLGWALREFVPDKDPPPRVWEAIEAKLALGVSPEEVRPLAWRSKASAWLRQALSSVQAVLLFLNYRPDEAGVWAEEQSTPVSGLISISAAPWPLYSFNSQILLIGFQTRRGISI